MSTVLPVTTAEAASPTPVLREDALPLVSVIIPVRNDARRLHRCLESIAASAYPSGRLEILVADNGSTDTSAQVAEALRARVLVFPDIRVSEVRNQAARAARGEILAFVDADHVLDPDWLPNAVDSLSKPDAAAVGAAYYAPADGTWVQRMYDSFRVRARGVRQVEWLGSGSLAVWRDVFEKVGGFDSRLETCEDVDFCQRLRVGGYGLWSDNRLRSVHLGDPRTIRALFFGELWRGRDNLRVSLRGPLTWRALPSVVIPVAILSLLVIGIGSLVILPDGWRSLRLAAAGTLLLTSLRAGRMLSRIRRFDPLTILRAFAVALVYDISRALALVVRTPHRMRQNASISKRVSGELP
jgi:glycosyltransferase involved in cell wall biosynthesis